MKRKIFILFLMFSGLTNQAQLEITITIKKNSSNRDTAVFVVKENGIALIDLNASATLSDTGNILRIVNQNRSRGYQVLLISDKGNPSTFSKILNDIVPAQGTIFEKKFSKNEKLSRFSSNPSDGDEIFSLPCSILVQKTDPSGNIKPIGSRTILSKEKPQAFNDRPFVFSKGFAGVPCYDAVSLANYRQMSPLKFMEILNYYNGKTGITEPRTLFKSLEDNKFLSDFLSTVDQNYVAGFKQTEKFGFGKTLSSAGGLDVTNIADGLAKFLVKRTKEELSITFFDRLKKELNDTNYRDLKTLFPSTCQLLNVIDQEIYDYQKYIQNFRESFRSDLLALNRNLPGIMSNHTKLFPPNSINRAIVISGCYLAGSLEDRMHPGDILEDFPLDSLQGFGKDFRGAILTLQLLSSSLRDTSTAGTSDYWVNLQQIRELVNDKMAFRIYLGLLYEQAKRKYPEIEFSGKKLVEVLDEVANNYDVAYASYKKFILGLAEKTDALNKMIKTTQSPAKDSSVFDLYAKFFEKTVGLVEYATSIGDLPYFNLISTLKDLKKKSADYFSVAKSSCSLAIDINQKNYSAAVNQLLTIYQVIVIRYDTSSKDCLHKISRYGSFAAALVTAKSSDEVETVIESFALPAGSARIKRETPFNVSLNAYCGLFLGYERIRGADGAWPFCKINSYGVAAPVGIAFSWGHRVFFVSTGKSGWNKSKGYYGWSTSAFISLIDIGALAAFRFQNNDSIAQVPKIQLKDIVSPGLFLSIGFPKWPLSLNLGAQVGPNLRSVYVEDKNNPGQYINSYQENVYWRYSASLVVDIPIFNFYTKSRK